MAKVTLSKICSNCGQEKPLSAFLTLSEGKGTIYGNVCSSCRKTSKNNQKTTQDSDEQTSNTTVTISSKTKIKEAADHRLYRKETEEAYLEEQEENQLEQSLKQQKKHEIAKSETKHRETYLKSFLNKTEKDKTTTPTDVFGGEIQLQKERQTRLDVPTTDIMRVPKQKYGTTFRNEMARLGKFLGWVQKALREKHGTPKEPDTRYTRKK